MKKRIHYIYIFILFLAGCKNKPSIIWERTIGRPYNDNITRICTTNDGGYLLAGATESENNNTDCWIIKIDSNGNVLWQKVFGGTSYDIISSINTTKDGGYIFAGSINSKDGDIFGWHEGYDFLNSPSPDAWVVKLDYNGSIEWQKTLGGTKYDIASEIQQTSDDGYIVLGATESNDGDVTNHYGSWDIWIVKLNNNGEIQWERNFGGTEYDEGIGFDITEDGGYIIAGWSKSSDKDLNKNHGDYDYLIIKLDILGELEWQRTIGGTSEDLASDVKQTNDGGYIVVGSSQSNDGDANGWHEGYNKYNNRNSDVWVIKLNKIGIIEWQKMLGGTDSDAARSIQLTQDKEYIIAGYSRSSNGDVSRNYGKYDYWILKLDNNGNLIWEKSIGGSENDLAFSILITNDKEYIIVGHTESKDNDISKNIGKRDGWVVKLTSEN